MIREIKCDIFNSGADIIAHQTNCRGIMGGGIALTIRYMFPNVYRKYKEYCKKIMPLGTCQVIKVEDYDEYKNTYIANLFGQNDIGNIATEYDALEKSLNELVKFICNNNMNKSEVKVAFPYKISCGLAGGDWNRVLPMLVRFSEKINCEVIICKL